MHLDYNVHQRRVQKSFPAGEDVHRLHSHRQLKRALQRLGVHLVDVVLSSEGRDRAHRARRLGGKLRRGRVYLLGSPVLEDDDLKTDVPARYEDRDTRDADEGEH